VNRTEGVLFYEDGGTAEERVEGTVGGVEDSIVGFIMLGGRAEVHG
jgi:hypothetical protein